MKTILDLIGPHKYRLLVLGQVNVQDTSVDITRMEITLEMYCENQYILECACELKQIASEVCKQIEMSHSSAFELSYLDKSTFSFFLSVQFSSVLSV